MRQALDHEAEMRRLEELADWMDSRFRLPGTSIRFGLDSLVGLVPALGDGVAALPAVYLIHRAGRLGASRGLRARMAMNLGIDLVVGAVPLVGDLFDVGFKSNRRNIALLRRHLDRQSAAAPVAPLRPRPTL
ncbi:MAG: DUF4112 domain-containing protein [Tistlia sp.]|uniref:DUF4112 domain-containing protein n=1 Tax=Tistlia sp. TaxID=3057121 RepID=UPI0034A14774